MEINKVVRIGQGKTYNGRMYSIFCKIEYKDGRLSISGVEGPLRNGDALGGCGQIDMHLRDHQSEILPVPGWSPALLAEFFEVWQRWHLNDVIAGCEHQEFERRLGHKYEAWPHNLDAICPECGYSYGSRWNRREVPTEVLEFLTGLPDTDVQPAWV